MTLLAQIKRYMHKKIGNNVSKHSAFTQKERFCESLKRNYACFSAMRGFSLETMFQALQNLAVFTELRSYESKISF